MILSKKSLIFILLAVLIIIVIIAKQNALEQGIITEQAAVVTSFNPETKDIITDSFVHLNVPFVSQAPLGRWDDPRLEKGCEVTSVLMAWLWVKHEGIDPFKAQKSIIAAANFSIKNGYFGFNYYDAVGIMKDYHKYDKIEALSVNSIEEIKKELRAGNIVLLPALGRKLNNPNFVPPGPPRHMIVLRGFDDTTKEFIANDPGTRKGENHRYSYDIITNAMVDYPDNHRATKGAPKTIVVVKK